jgi:predicted acyl esterase
MHTRGEYDTSPYTAWESRDPGIWVPNGYGVVRAGLGGTPGPTGSLSPVSKEEARDSYVRIPTKLHSCSDVVEHWS